MHLPRFLVYFVYVLFVLGCSTNKKTISKPTASIVDRSRVVIHSEINGIEYANLSLFDGAISESCLIKDDTLDVFSLMKHEKDKVYDIAYTLAINGGNFPVRVSIPDYLDTTLIIHHNANNNSQLRARIVDNSCAQLVGIFDEENVDSEIRKWLYRKQQKNLGDSLITMMRLYAKDLLASELFSEEYTVIDKIPVYKSLSDVRVRVESNLEADYYYLFCCQEEEELDYLIETFISQKFDKAATTLDSELECYRKKGVNGNLCVFLVGINEDWSSTSIPCGVICLDNIAPKYKTLESDNSKKEFNFTNRSIQVTLSSTPRITGMWSVGYGQFEGWNPYSVPYDIHWVGDVEKVVIITGRGTSTTVDLRGKTTPVHQTISTYLSTGDNYIPMRAFDARGNISEEDLYIEIVRIKNDNPVINNDINIWDWD